MSSRIARLAPVASDSPALAAARVAVNEAAAAFEARTGTYDDYVKALTAAKRLLAAESPAARAAMKAAADREIERCDD